SFSRARCAQRSGRDTRGRDAARARRVRATVGRAPGRTGAARRDGRFNCRRAGASSCARARTGTGRGVHSSGNAACGFRRSDGQGVSGRVAASREPLLVRDVSEAKQHPLLKDQYFTTGSFISFPLVYHDDLVGVVNLTNRAMYGVFGEEDVERVRLLGLVIALV